MDQAQQIRPSWWQCLWGLPFLLVGGGLFVYTLFQGITHSTDSLTQLVVPGHAELNLKGKQTYTVFLEEQSVVNGKVYSTTQSIQGLSCTVTAKQDGTSVGVGRPSANTSYEVNGRSGHSVLDFFIPQDGQYLFACDYGANATGPSVVVAVGSGVGESIMRTMLVSMASLLGSFVACVAVVLIVWAMRERSKKRIRHTAPTQA